MAEFQCYCGQRIRGAQLGQHVGRCPQLRRAIAQGKVKK